MSSLASSPPVARSKMLPWLVLLAGLCALYVPTYLNLFRGIWSSESQGHGPIVLIVALWLIWRAWPRLYDDSTAQPRPAMAWPIFVVSTLLYVIGRSQDIIIFELGSFIGMLMAIVLLLRGTAHLKPIWFALFFMLFMIPLPGTIVDALTQPMKIAVSIVTEWLLYNAGFPVARNGVILQVGQYQLLVADACAGLQTLFTLESMGLLYLNLVRHSSLFRNIALAILIVPISFIANVIRVVILTLVTYYFGDEAGQGFIHGFAGLVLFISALLLIIGTDTLLRVLGRRRSHTIGVAA